MQQPLQLRKKSVVLRFPHETVGVDLVLFEDDSLWTIQRLHDSSLGVMQAGLQVGDILHAINFKAIKTEEDLNQEMTRKGHPIVLQFVSPFGANSQSPQHQEYAIEDTLDNEEQDIQNQHPVTVLNMQCSPRINIKLVQTEEDFQAIKNWLGNTKPITRNLTIVVAVNQNENDEIVACCLGLPVLETFIIHDFMVANKMKKTCLEDDLFQWILNHAAKIHCKEIQLITNGFAGDSDDALRVFLNKGMHVYGVALRLTVGA